MGLGDPIYLTFAVWAVLIGLAIGSFWNVAIARWPEDRSVIAPRSACPSCNTPVAATDNIPVLSWILLRGRCRHCGWAIPPTYPLVEVLGGLLGFLVFRRFVPDVAAIDAPHLAAACLYFVFVGCLVITAYVDLKHSIIPDEVTIYAVPVGVLGIVGLDWLGYDGWMALGWRQSVLGALGGGLSMGAVAAAAYFVSGRQALGLGDVKLFAMIGAFTGVHPSLFAILLGTSLTMSAVGLAELLITQRRSYQPLGPAIAGFSLVYLLYADVLLRRFSPTLYHWLQVNNGL